ncbi:MAG: hypothetical protein ACI9G1_003919 [Pirellulaceae bacterium]|jgi:hypothetical protein
MTIRSSFFALCVILLLHSLVLPEFATASDDLLRAVSLYASFDDKLEADFGGGELSLRTRSDHPTKKGEYVFQDGYDSNVFRLASDSGVAGGALRAVDILPRRGRLFYPAAKNLAFNRNGWSGAVSMWLNTDPNTIFKSPYCDPVQITQKGAHDGGIWLDFPDVKPRDMRMGIYHALQDGEKAVKELDPKAPLVHLRRVPFKVGQWHHVVISWSNFDSSKGDALAQLFVDGRLIGEMKDREIAMNWEIEKTGIYIAVSYIGHFDELAVFNRALTANEISKLHAEPDWLNKRKHSLAADPK